MRLTVIGSGTGVPWQGRGPAGYLVEAAGRSMLFDCGPGTLERVNRFGHDWKAIDRIFLTHHHPDHSADLVAFLFAGNWAAEQRTRDPLRVRGPRGTSAFVEALHRLFPGLAWKRARTLVDDWDGGGECAEDDVVVKGLPVDHADLQALAFSIEHAGKTLVYSGDTGETSRIVEAARNADTLVVECSFPNAITHVTSHLTAGGAGRVAAAAGVRRVVLTHFYPECEGVDIVAECREAFSGEIVLARDGLVIDI
ncbi:MAG: ribonuclease Z [Proteobacteria bacterium]|nr:ribonuclease Z [Pseudomonadota bacterium]